MSVPARLQNEQPSFAKVPAHASTELDDELDEYMDASHVLLEKIWLPLQEMDSEEQYSEKQYLTPEWLRHHGVDVYQLSLTTGQAEDSGPKFVELASHAEIRRMLDEAQPFRTEGIDPPDFGFDATMSNLWQARDIWTFFEDLLTRTETYGEPNLLAKTGMYYRGYVSRLVFLLNPPPLPSHFKIAIHADIEASQELLATIAALVAISDGVPTRASSASWNSAGTHTLIGSVACSTMHLPCLAA